MRGENGIDNEALLFNGERAGTGEANASAVEVFSNGASDTFEVAIKLLEMHRTPDWSRLDVEAVEVANELKLGEAEHSFVDQEAAEPIGVASVWSLRHEREADVRESVTVAKRQRAAFVDAGFEHL